MSRLLLADGGCWIIVCQRWLVLLVMVVWTTTTTTTSGVGVMSSSSFAVNALSTPVVPPLSTKTADHIPLARKAMEYLDASTDPFHAVKTSIDLLTKAGFQELSDTNDDTTIQVGGKYYYSVNKSTLVAFCVGGQYNSGSGGGGGIKVIGGHTDSPNLRVKPRSKRTSNNCIQLGVECYGGGLWHTWFDRDLGLSGRVLVRNSNNGGIQQRLVKIDRALLRISNLAIHLQTVDERKAFKINKEDHLSPILALEAKKALTNNGDKKKEDEGENNTKGKKEEDGWTEYQEPALLQVLAHELDIDVKDIVDFELSLFDIQKATLGGVFSEFIHSARLDNLASCFMAVQALVHYVESGLYEQDTDVSMIVLYDHEEVGSTSAVGAASPILNQAVKKITTALGNVDSIDRCIAKSFVLSSDQAHAVHPNYASKHEKNHQPQMNRGMVIKRNSNQRYATTAVTGVLIREVARMANLPPVQEFVVRQDCGCGSTIGPAISASTGIRTIDMGCPQLSMHSIRETMGICDITNGLNLFKAFFEHFRVADSSLEH